MTHFAVAVVPNPEFCRSKSKKGDVQLSSEFVPMQPITGLVLNLCGKMSIEKNN